MLIFILLVCCIHHFLQNLVTWHVKLLINVMLYIAITSTHCSEWYEKLCDKFVSSLASHEDWSNCLHLLTFSLFRVRESERQIHIMDHLRNMDIFLSLSTLLSDGKKCIYFCVINLRFISFLKQCASLGKLHLRDLPDRILNEHLDRSILSWCSSFFFLSSKNECFHTYMGDLVHFLSSLKHRSSWN